MKAPAWNNDYRRLYIFFTVAVLILDQVSKLIVTRSIPLNDSVNVIPGFFRISHVLNPGAAFSFLADSRSPYVRVGLMVFSIAVILIITTILWKAKRQFNLTNAGLSLVLGGALGNLLDRIFTGSVVDFLAFRLGTYHWPDFNIADSGIVVGSALLMIDVFFESKTQETLVSR